MKHTRITALLLAAVLLFLLPAPGAARAAEEILITFDGNLIVSLEQFETFPAGTSLQDIIDNATPTLLDTEEWHFAGWSPQPCGSRETLRGNHVSVYEDRRLYAVWERKLLSAQAVLEPGWNSSPRLPDFTVSVGDRSDMLRYEIYGSGWWSSLDELGDNERIHAGAFEEGATYYASLYFRAGEHYAFSEDTALTLSDNVKLVSRRLVKGGFDADDLEAVISYTHASAPATVRSVSLFVENLTADAALEWGCARFCLSPGVEPEPNEEWWDSAQDVMNYDRRTQDQSFRAGKRYYSYFELWLEEGSVFSENTEVTLRGGEVISVERGSDYDGRVLYVVYAVDVPETVLLSAQTALTYEAPEQYPGAFCTDFTPYLSTSLESLPFPAGAHTFTAMPREGFTFDGWYLRSDGGPSEALTLLSQEPVAELTLTGREGSLICRFTDPDATGLTICGRPVTAQNAQDVLGDGVFRYEPDERRLLISGVCEYPGQIIYSSIDGLTIETVRDSTLRNTDSTSVRALMQLHGSTLLCGKGLLTLQNDGRNVAIYVRKKAALTLKDANVHVQTAQYGISGDEGEETMSVDHSNLFVSAEPEKAMAIAFFDRFTLINCAIVEPAEVLIVGGDVFHANNTPLNKVVITANEQSQLPYEDAKAGTYYYDAVKWAYVSGIVNGVSATEFAPGSTCTRGQIMTFIWRYKGSPEPQSDKTEFTDLNKASYYYKPVLWAVENGIAKGTSATEFSPNAPCTRGHAVTFLWRSVGQPEPTTTQHPFTDAASSAFYFKAMLWAVERGITKGMSESSFAPDAPCTRAQIVTFLNRLMQITQ